MKMRTSASALALLLCAAGSTYAQRGDGPRMMEFGGLGGFSLVRGLTVEQGSTKAKTGFENSFTGGAFLSRDSYKHVAGEVRYLFHGGAAMIESGGQRSTLAAQQHLFTYDLVYHFTRRGRRLRPFLSAGGGGRLVVGSGAEHTSYPGSGLVALTATTQMLPVFGGGGGVKIRLNRQVSMRFEFRDYISPAPRNILAAPPGSTLHGWMHDLMPLFGISYLF
ncbi:MAG: outer membrane beta-barrel protein [Bryobacterales bacterium]|nr:outer membrane beta-barrel protein [Bryobacterales bacterium]